MFEPLDITPPRIFLQPHMKHPRQSSLTRIHI
jgi:hypothetical protein